MWVKIPTLSYTTDTVFYVWYGNSSATAYAADATYGSQAVWSNGYVGVWHLNESGNGTVGEYKDSTSTTNDGRGGGGNSSYVPTAVDGKIGKGQDLDGNDFIIMESAPVTGSGVRTITAWIKPDDASGTEHIIGWGSRSTAHLYELDKSNSTFIFIGYGNEYTTNLSFSTTDWNFYGCRQSDTTFGSIDFFLNTNWDKSWSNTNTVDTGTVALTIGREPVNNDCYYSGLIDEIHISNVARTDGWIATEYNNQSSPATFATPIVSFVPKVIFIS